MPHKKMPAIKEFHYEGVRGALGIDSGYQKILDVPGYEQVWWVWGHQRIAIEQFMNHLKILKGGPFNIGDKVCSFMAVLVDQGLLVV
jgi:hypothetical protein